MTSVIGLDLSLTSTGVATADGTMTIVSEPYGTSLYQRHLRLGELLDQITAVLPSGLVTVVVESPSLGQKRQAGTLDRNGLWWLVVSSLIIDGVRVVEATPATVKKFATGKGTAPKPDLRMALYKRAGLDIADDNQVDAWWLRQIGLHLLGHPDRLALPAVQLSALDKIDKSTIKLREEERLR